MKKTLFAALVALISTITTLAAGTDPVNITITLKNGETVTYAAAQMDSVRFVGGQFGETGAIGMKIYLKNSTQSVDYLYSQIETMTCTEPVNGTVFRRINDISKLEAGKRYIIVYEEGLIALPNKVNSNDAVKLGQAVIIENNTIILEGDNHGVGIFTLGEGYTLKYSNPSSDGTYYLTLANNNTGLRATQNPQNWSITFSGYNAQIVANDGTDDRWIREYDATGGADFRTYKTTTTNGNPVQLYMEDDGSVPVTTVSAPVFSPNGGLINTATDVTISCDTDGAAIYYTTDGSTPSTTNGTLYSTPITVSETTTIKARAIKDGFVSTVTTVTFTYTDGPIIDNNVNANWHESRYLNANDHTNLVTSRATYGLAWGLEYPHISTDANSIVAVHATNDYGVSLSIELDKNKRANRWTCFTMHNGVPNNNVGRYNKWREDPCVPSSAQVDNDEYTDGKYTTTTTNLDGSSMTLFSRGHICASEDRQTLKDQNSHTFYTSNCHPQYQAHNAGIWGRMESKVQEWGYSNTFRDTLYVCKGATIADVTLNNTTSTGVITNAEVYNQFGVNITGTLTIPRYWYMAVLCLKNGQYRAMAFWSEQTNSSSSNTTLSSCVITIDELERRTGIDFFCNLPDDIEAAVEATVDSSFWNVGN